MYAGLVSPDDMADIAAQINCGGTQPPDWWDVVRQRHLANTRQSREEAITMLKKLLGDRWQAASLEQAEKAVTEAGKAVEGGKP